MHAWLQVASVAYAVVLFQFCLQVVASYFFVC